MKNDHTDAIVEILRKIRSMELPAEYSAVKTWADTALSHAWDAGLIQPSPGVKGDVGCCCSGEVGDVSA